VPREFDPKPVLRTLLAHRVDFVLIGGLAGTAHGSAYPTFDVDIGRTKDKLMATEYRVLADELRADES
jgi:hypothetical protein